MSRTRFTPAVQPLRPDLIRVEGAPHEMLMHEALARARMREAEQAAQHYRLARRVAAARSWQRFATWAARRAAQAGAAL